MNIKDQVLSIEQIKELRELGFDVNKHSSLKSNGKQIIVKDDFYIGGAPLFPTMTIGDIMDILPKVINSHGIEYGRNADYGLSLIYLNKYYIRYIGIHISLALIIFESCNLIDVLFEALKWCIKEKHIEL